MAGLKRKVGSSVAAEKVAKRAKISYKKKRTYRKKVKRSYKKMPGKRRSYRRSDPSGGAYRAGASRMRAANREAKWGQYVNAARNALDGRMARRQKSMAEGYSNRAWGQGKYGLGKLARSAFNAVSANEKKHHTLGRAAMRMAGLGMYTGIGAYEEGPETNSLVNNGGLVGVPSFASSGDETGAVTIQHREYVTELYGPTDSFTNQAFALNPGLERTFPWLSQIAANYEEYELVQCLFTYRSTTSEQGTTNSGQVGTIIMATQYNPSKPAWDSKQIMMGYDAAGSGKATSDQIHGVECDNAKISGTDEKYVRSGPVLDDLKNYDHGTFQIAISNSPAAFANQALGELWVTYTVTLRKPKLYSGRGFAISQDLFVQPQPGNSYPLAGSTRSALLLSGKTNSIGCKLLGKDDFLPQSQVKYSGLLNDGLTAQTLGQFQTQQMTTIGDNAIVFPAGFGGYVEIDFRLNCTDITYDTATWALNYYGNVEPVYDILSAGIGGSASFYSFQTRASGTAMSDFVHCVWHVRVKEATDGNNNIFRFHCNLIANPASFHSCVMKITEYNASGSYKSFGKGDSDAPIMVDVKGEIVNPVD